MEAQGFIRREKVSSTANQTHSGNEGALLEKRLTAGIGAEELEIFSDVLKKMQENMELTEKGAGYG